MVVALTTVGVIGVGCSDDEAAEATTESSAHSESAASACQPVGDGGGTAVTVTLDEWSVAAMPASVSAGAVTFDVRNDGEEPHELVVVRGVAPEALTVVDSRVDEDALPDGAFIGEVEAFPAGETCNGTFELAPGSYTLFCNIVEQHDGEPESHVESGMVTTFEVR
jgi:hypothetical protein